MARQPYPTDVTDDEWAYAASHLTLMCRDAPQRRHDLREVFNALRWMVRAGASWRMLPHDLPPWRAVYQQTRRWLQAGVFEDMASEMRTMLRLGAGRGMNPSAVVLDSRTLRSTPESGGRAGYDGAKRTKGSKVHLAVDTLGHLLALHVAPADEGGPRPRRPPVRGGPPPHRQPGRGRVRRPGLHGGGGGPRTPRRRAWSCAS